MLPSKKIIVALVILVLGTALLVVYKYRKNSDITYDSASNNLTVVTSSPNLVNNLVRTDSDSPVSKINGAATTTPEMLSATDILAQDLLVQLVKTNKSGTKITTDNASQFVSDYLKTAPLPTINKNLYSAKDLSIIDSDNTNMHNYQTAITAVFTKYWPAGDKQNEMLILNETFSNNDPSVLDKLSAIISIYENALKGSLSVSVPQQAISKHLAVINSLSAYIQTLKMIQLAYTDSISGVVGLGAFLKNQGTLVSSMADLRLFLINNIK